jgi:choline dehydrogenase-like flavoprotein
MGTTRMSDDAGKGVVDSDCRVHGIANLYVASSSVFPTSGFANPTLTILALAVRLADHIKSTVLTGPTGAGNEIRRTWEHAHAEGLNS